MCDTTYRTHCCPIRRISVNQGTSGQSSRWHKAGKQAKDYWVGGIDGTPDGLKLMAEGKMAVSVFQDAAGQAGGAVDTALRLVRGEVLESTVVWVPFKLITPENRQAFE